MILSRPGLVRWAILFGAIALPILLVANCSGFTSATMQVGTCTLDWPILRSLADQVYGWLLISSFTLGIPVFLYLGVVLFVAFKAEYHLSTRKKGANKSPS